MSLLCVKELSKTYGDGIAAVPALQGVSFDLDQGSFTAIIGKSGSGKSTLLNLISGVDTPTSGSIFINGQNMCELSDVKRTIFRRRHIGVVYQSFNLIPDFTVSENICLPLYIDKREPDSAYIYSLLHQLELYDKKDRLPNQLSGGEQQRTAVARALAVKPDILLADEPTGNLDTKTSSRLLAVLRECSYQYGQTILLVTHDLDIARSTQRILVLSDGRLTRDMKDQSDEI